MRVRWWSWRLSRHRLMNGYCSHHAHFIERSMPRHRINRLMRWNVRGNAESLLTKVADNPALSYVGRFGIASIPRPLVLK